MRKLLIIAVSIATSMFGVSAAPRAASQATGETNPLVVLDNPRVRVYRATATGPLTGVDHGPGVLVSVEDSPGGKAGFAVWIEDAALPSRALLVRDVIVQPRGQATSATPPVAGSKPGDAPFIGMSDPGIVSRPG